MSPLRIYLFGTSSVGKSTLLRAFPQDEWVTYDIDQQAHEEITGKALSKLPNKFMSDLELDVIYSKAYAQDILKYMRAGITNRRQNFVFADVPDEKPARVAIHSLPSGFVSILIYASPITLIHNMAARLSKQPRGMWVLNSVFANIYHVTKDKSKAIDTIDTSSVKNAITKELKWNFAGKDDLDKFVKDMFAKMGIHDDKSHMIEYVYPVRMDAIVKLDEKGQTPSKNVSRIIELVNEKCHDHSHHGGDESFRGNIVIYIVIILLVIFIIIEYKYDINIHRHAKDQNRIHI